LKCSSFREGVTVTRGADGAGVASTLAEDVVSFEVTAGESYTLVTGG
jgi:hypothetical protein